MKLILRSKTDNNFISIPIKEFVFDENFLKAFNHKLKEPIEAVMITTDEEITVNALAKLKAIFEKLEIKDFHIYSNSREIIVTGKSLKINSVFLNDRNFFDKELYLNFPKDTKDTIYQGTVRSGNRISSNGDLYIIGDVNPGAIVSAKRNVYVWGKLLGIASAGEDGNKNSSIASLYLNPLQLRISEIIAVGPKEKPKYQYPEIAVVENQSIVIKPYLVDTSK